ncbi:MAG: methylated-DNA--[protein]-cysteine S-methyltransferase [Firmicutes bacterium]|nr:methylated-DNA--[protein]-cysteine S-methyltransferase [Bacillota bacterium]
MGIKGFNIYRTEWGVGAAIFSEMGLAGIVFPHSDEVALEEEIVKNFGKQDYREDLGQDLCSSLGRYFSGERVQFDYQLDYTGVTEFQRKVYETLKAVPYGETTTYKRLAEQCGSPMAARAVGGAMARNPYPVVVPCHRVLKSDGSIGGWSGKRGWKERMLVIEGILPISYAEKVGLE